LFIRSSAANLILSLKEEAASEGRSVMIGGNDLTSPHPRLAVDRRHFLRIARDAGAGLAIGAHLILGSEPANQAQLTDAKFPPRLRARAIVIGINKTTNAPELSNPVKDARRYVQWLIDKGGVRVQDILLLTSPPLAKPLAGIAIGEATGNAILRAIHDVPLRIGARERLFLYFSGHGTAYQPKAWSGRVDEQDAIIPCDYEPGLSQGISIPWIFEYLRASRFSEQFFFFDACRTLSPDDNPRVGKNPPSTDCDCCDPMQYTLYATSPSRKTLDKTGTFTDLLLAGLTIGKGTAKTYDSRENKYLVRWDRLAAFLKSHFHQPQNRVVVGHENGRDIYMEPEEKVLCPNNVADYPLLAVLRPKDDVPPVKLTLNVYPSHALNKLHISIAGQETKRMDRPPPALVAPLSLDLLPRLYYLEIRADGYYEPHPTRLFELTDDREESVTLLPGEATSVPEFTNAPAGSLKLSTADSLASLEVADSAGAVLKGTAGRPLAGLGELGITKLKPGFYRARLYTPDGSIAERIVRLAAGASEKVELTGAAVGPPPSRVSEALAQAVGSLAARWPSPERSTAVPPPSAFLVQAARVVDQERQWDQRLEQIGLTRFPEGRQGFRIILAVEGGSADQAKQALDRIKLRLGALDARHGALLGPSPSKVPGVAVFTHSAIPGPYRLRFDKLGDLTKPSEQAHFALSLLKDRLCELIVYQDLAGRMHMTQFAPESHPTMPLNSDIVRKLGSLQRDLQSGQARTPFALLDELSRCKVVEPIVACIRLYLLSLQGKPQLLRSAARNVVERFPGLADGHVALARSMEASKEKDANQNYRAALKCGLPVLMPFLQLLQAGVGRYKIEDARVPLLRQADARRIPFLLWSAWRPE
jgi:hypothetical protein